MNKEYDYFRVPMGAQEAFATRNGMTLKGEFVNIEEWLTTQKNSLIERIEGMKRPLQEKHDTLKAQYDLAYHRWFTAGHRGEALERELKRFESGVNGNVMASCADKLEALDDVLKIIREEV